jgi:phage tail sheath gpL-like
MTISFNEIPTNLRVPFVAVEFDASQAAQGPAILAYTGLIIGQKLAAGTQAADTLVKVSSVEEVITLAGRGSMLHRQAIGWFASNRITEVYIGVLDDDGAAVDATGTVTFTGPATEAGTVVLYLGGVRITAAVADADTATTIGTAVAAAINANLDLPVTAGDAAGVVTLTARNGGAVMNDYDIRLNFNDGESLPAGVTAVVVPMASGANNPVLTALIAAMGDQWFNIWAHPYTDATSLAAIEAELTDRNGPLRMIDGLAITSAAGTAGTLTTLGNGRNNRHSCIVCQPSSSILTPPMEFGAETAAIVAKFGQADPARPFQTLPMANALAPADDANIFTLEERNLLLTDGIATTKIAGTVTQLERIITTYQTNPSAAPDTAYLDATTLLTLMYLRFSFRVRMQNRYPRHKLANDGTRFGPGQKVITPSLGKAEAVGWFREMETLGLVEGFDQFKTDLRVLRNVPDPNRLDFLLPPDLINQLIVTATQIAFRL